MYKIFVNKSRNVRKMSSIPTVATASASASAATASASSAAAASASAIATIKSVFNMVTASTGITTGVIYMAKQDIDKKLDIIINNNKK
jgi:3-oxoacyl-ACP reductase-like protein